MPTVTVRVPIPGKSSTFASRARRRGIGALFTQQPVALPGGNVFVRPKGVGAFFTQQPVALPGPNVFVRPRGMQAKRVVIPNFARRTAGMGAFTIEAPPVVFPGKDIFAKYQCPQASSCSKCSHPCGRRGMGQDGTFLDDDVLTDSAVNSDMDASLNNLLTAPVSSPSPSLLETAANPFATYSSTGAESIYATPSELAAQDALSSSNAAAAGAYSDYALPSNASSSVAANAAPYASMNAANVANSITAATQGAASIAKAVNSTSAPTTAAPAGYQYVYNPSTGQWSLQSTSSLSSLGTSLSTWVSQNMGTVVLVGGVFAVLLVASGNKKGKR